MNADLADVERDIETSDAPQPASRVLGPPIVVGQHGPPRRTSELVSKRHALRRFLQRTPAKRVSKDAVAELAEFLDAMANDVIDAAGFAWQEQCAARHLQTSTPALPDLRGRHVMAAIKAMRDQHRSEVTPHAGPDAH